MSKRDKCPPKQKAKTERRKHVRSVPSAEPVPRKQLAWSLALVDLEGKFGWHRLTPDWAQHLREKFRAFESTTIDELFQNRTHNHPVSIESFSKLARQRHTELVGERDNSPYLSDSWVSLSVNGVPRIIGIRDREVVRIVWWDPEHQVCPSILKHT